MKNRLLQWICKILPKPKHKNNENKRILIVSTTALGDTLWATPTIESTRKSFPNAYISILTSRIGKEVLKTNPFIDTIHTIKEPLLFSLFSLWKTLYKEKFDTILLLHASQRLIFPLCALIGASNIIGTKGINKGLDSFLTHPLKPYYEHEILRRLRMVETIQGTIHTEKLTFIPEKITPPRLPKGRWIAIHPGSKDGFKRWPIEQFAILSQMLQKQLGYQILITGTSQERALMEDLHAQVEGSLLMDSNISLHNFALILTQTALLITNDTGPVHLACAINHPVVALYAATDPKLCGPHQAQNAKTLFKGPTCTPCIKRKCKRPFCLLQISPKEVFNAAQTILSPQII